MSIYIIISLGNLINFKVFTLVIIQIKSKENKKSIFGNINQNKFLSISIYKKQNVSFLIYRANYYHITN